jgi:hypothetical protein
MRLALTAMVLCTLAAEAAAQTPGPAQPAPPGAYPPPPYPYAYPPVYYPPPGYYPPPPGYAPAPPAPPPSPPFVHDGFYLRLNVGPGYGYVTTTSMGQTLTMSGGSLANSFAIGGTIAPNVILYGGFLDNSILSPRYVLDGSTVNDDGSSILIAGLGPGVAYYFMPSNAYVAGTLMVSRLSQAVYRGREAISNWGPTLEGLVGKEWWVSANWGVGVAAQIVVSRLGLRGDDEAALNIFEAALLLSATYN